MQLGHLSQEILSTREGPIFLEGLSGAYALKGGRTMNEAKRVRGALGRFNGRGLPMSRAGGS